MPNADPRFQSFLNSSDGIWIFGPTGIIFKSQQRGIAPLLSYIEHTPLLEEVVIFDKITGNAAALLMKKASCSEAFSSIGSESAALTLQRFDIICHFAQTVPHIINREGNGMCPFETMSLEKSPDEFYELVRTHSLFADIFSGSSS